MSSICKEIALCLCHRDINGSGQMGPMFSKHHNRMWSVMIKIHMISDVWNISRRDGTSLLLVTQPRQTSGSSSEKTAFGNERSPWVVLQRAQLPFGSFGLQAGRFGPPVWQPLGTLWNRKVLFIYFTSSRFSLAEYHFKVCNWSCWSSFYHSRAALESSIWALKSTMSYLVDTFFLRCFQERPTTLKAHNQWQMNPLQYHVLKNNQTASRAAQGNRNTVKSIAFLLLFLWGHRGIPSHSNSVCRPAQ